MRGLQCSSNLVVFLPLQVAALEDRSRRLLEALHDRFENFNQAGEGQFSAFACRRSVFQEALPERGLGISKRRMTHGAGEMPKIDYPTVYRHYVATILPVFGGGGRNRTRITDSLLGK